eukprot:TRINITY_DN8848_c0_g1_i7.p2 TRINITY_DN8848_c0_g1~~TRINITY_DN8848_c0_g1_i7.p2  ORF type:complete len:164 (+),score=28.55 TRINITY_DN8848_c0_g1_i7:112-603(+)
MIRRPPRSTLSSSSAASDVYKRQVGDSVGLSLGELDGASLGVAVGDNVGLSLGDWEGVAVGMSVGLDVGVAVGLLVGESEGANVGEAVGPAVGVWVGAVDGEVDGKGVGAGVGGASGSKQQLQIRTLLGSERSQSKVLRALPAKDTKHSPDSINGTSEDVPYS